MQLLCALQKTITFCHLHNPQGSDAFILFSPVSQWYKKHKKTWVELGLDLNWKEGSKEGSVKEKQDVESPMVCMYLVWAEVRLPIWSVTYTRQSRREKRVAKSLRFMKLGSWREMETHISALRATWAKPSIGLQRTYTHGTALLKVSQEKSLLFSH